MLERGFFRSSSRAAGSENSMESGGNFSSFSSGVMGIGGDRRGNPVRLRLALIPAPGPERSAREQQGEENDAGGQDGMAAAKDVELE